MKELRYFYQALLSLATWVKALIVGLCATTLIGVAAFFGPRVALLMALIVFVLLVLWGLYYLISLWVRRRRAAELKGELVTTAAHRGIADPAARGRLADLRRNFAKGVERFEAAGKDLYELPWYVIVGEPGSGKTEAIRHAEVGFPPGLQDDFQGVGGTINMNWWFTNYAVILDTAGRLVFEEVEPGATGEWREFLELLKKHRPHSPINGLLLALPADSLFQDSPEELERKAAKLARQLAVIQKQLDVRFPVFVLVTKADLVSGFREFFEDLDVKAQYQMLGWSNPAPLDAPFRPELLRDHLVILCRRLQQRRTLLLQNPVASSGTRRTDEVDQLYEFPANLQALTPKLQRYLEIMFVAGQWTNRPPFLRGIYFNSSLREGTALDAALAEVLGVPVAQLPEGRAWERERSFFLKDIFLDKVFREDGLVTRATDVERLMLRRKLVLFGFGIVGLLLLLVFGLAGYRTLRNDVYAQIGFWNRAMEKWGGSAGQPIVAAPTSASSSLYTYEGDTPIGPSVTGADFNDPGLSLVEFHEALRERAAEPLGIPWLFRPLTFWGSNPDRDRDRAQRVVFETGVVRPLLDAARVKLGASDGRAAAGGASDPRPPERLRTLEEKALAVLVRVEIAALRREAGSPDFGDKFLNPLLEYVSDKQAPAGLAEVMERTYSDNPDGRGTWAPPWASGGATLQQNRAIKVGLDHLVADAQKRGREFGANLQLLRELADAVRNYRQLEESLAQKAGIKNDPGTSDREVQAGLSALRDAKTTMDQLLVRVHQAGLSEDASATLSGAYQKVTAGVGSTIGQIQAEIERALPTPNADEKGKGMIKPAQEDPRYALLRDVKTTLADLTQRSKAQLEGAISEPQRNEFRELDEVCLAPLNGRPPYLVRWDLYQACQAGVPQYRYDDRMDLIGQNWGLVQQLSQGLSDLQTRVAAYPGKLKEPFSATCSYLIRRFEEEQQKAYLAGYLRKAKAVLRSQLRFPLLRDPGPDNTALSVDQVRKVKVLLLTISRDLQSDLFARMPADARQPITTFSKALDSVIAVVDAVLHADGSPTSVKIMLLDGQAQRNLSGPNLAPAPTPLPVLVGNGNTAILPPPLDYNVRDWNGVQLLGGGHAPGVVPLNTSADVTLGTVKVNEGFRFRVFHTPTGGDSQMVDAGSNWSALRVLSRYNGIPVGTGRVWRVALKPGEPMSVWIELVFEQTLPSLPNWPTLDTLDLRNVVRP